ncbi:MAG TPA: beta-propeller domain-containing protein [Acidimicrobiia bacterium]
MRKSVAVVAALVIAVTACTGTSTTSTTTRGVGSFTGHFDPTQISFSAHLTPFSACDGVLTYFKEEALSQVTAYGLDGYPGPIIYERDGFFPAAGEFATTMAATTTAGSSMAGGEGTGYSGTNVQVAGVDEPDIVKTDGTRILSIVNGVLRYVDVSGDAPELLGQLALEAGWDQRFFVSGDRAFIFSNGDMYAMPFFTEGDARIMPPYGYGSQVTIVQEVDLSNPAQMKVVRTLRIDGTYLSSRAVGDTVRVVVSSYPQNLPFVYPSSEAAEDLALETNKRVIQESTIENWLPSYVLYDRSGDEIDSGMLVECSRMNRPADFSGFDTLSVLTLDLGSALDAIAGTGVIAKGETVYASATSLYVATNVWVPGDADQAVLDGLGERYTTSIHRFDISGTGPASYRASGSVDGHLLNQYSMDEYDGFLRVATTDGAPWGTTDTTSSHIVVLTERDDELVQAGEVGDMGQGESIYSVRFIGPAAYVVTFRQVDPLYVVDLSDPEAPTVSGELKINGYSSYLHPLGDGMLLGIGQDANDQGMTKGAKATLFDVSDPSNPRAVSSWTLADAYSDVEWDQLAFLYWAPASIVVLPMQSWNSQFFGAVVLKTDDGLREFGRISHHIETNDLPSDCREVRPDTSDAGVVIQICAQGETGVVSGYYCSPAYDSVASIEEGYGVELGEVGPTDTVSICWQDYGMQDPQILRSLVIGDTLWTLSWRSLQANTLDDLSVTGSVFFG